MPREKRRAWLVLRKGSKIALVVQRIGRGIADPVIEVRFLSRAKTITSREAETKTSFEKQSWATRNRVARAGGW